MKRSRRGTSFIDLIISLAIIGILFGGIYLVYFSLVTAIGNISVREAATTAVNGEIETIRNLPYDSVGTVSGIPSGVIPQTQAVTEGNYTFSLATTIRNIDDPFDGTVNGSPADTAPADYKLVEIDASCPSCTNPISVSITTTVAPKNLESATQNGSLFLYALDANGNAVSGATVHVVNASVTPSINLTDTTNASGVLQLVGVPTSTQGYQITVTKTGYSSDRTYPIGGPSNPNPLKPNSTVAAQTVTNVTFSIDVLSTLTATTEDELCRAIPNESFAIQGGKLIGTSPNILKFSTTTATNASGTFILPSLEWDTYSITLNDLSKNVVGTIPLTPVVLNPSSTQNIAFILQSAANPSLLVNVLDSGTGLGITNATVNIVKGATNVTAITGHDSISQSNWAAGSYASESGGIDTATNPNAITLLANASGTYNTNTNDWLMSNTFDLGGANSKLYGISWSPLSEPPGTSISFQVAGNNNNATWNFIGPDGTNATFFTVTSTLPTSLSGDRYIRYEVFFNTTDPTVTPTLSNIAIDFAADCVPPAQTLFGALPTGTYTVTVSAGGYTTATSSVAISSGSQSTTIQLAPQ